MNILNTDLKNKIGKWLEEKMKNKSSQDGKVRKKTLGTQKAKTLMVSGLLSAAIASFGTGCGLGFQSTQYSEANLPSVSNANPVPDVTPTTPGGDNGNIGIVIGAKTVGVPRFKAAFDSMVSMAGITPSATTLATFNANAASFSETGSVLSINAPMLMSYLAVGTDVCNDLIVQETAVNPASSRRAFPQFDFAANNNTSLRAAADGSASPALSDAVRRLARLFWQRNETAAELAMINTGVQELVNSNPALPTNGAQRLLGLYVCTSMISSTSAYQM